MAARQQMFASRNSNDKSRRVKLKKNTPQRKFIHLFSIFYVCNGHMKMFCMAKEAILSFLLQSACIERERALGPWVMMYRFHHVFLFFLLVKLDSLSALAHSSLHTV